MGRHLAPVIAGTLRRIERPTARWLHRWMAAVLFLVALLPGVSAAHTAGKGLATISVNGATVEYSLLLAMAVATADNANGLQLGKPAGQQDYQPLLQAIEKHLRISAGDSLCKPGSGQVTPPSQEGGNVTVRMRFECPIAADELRIHDDLFDVLGGDYHTIANIQWSGGSQQHVFLPTSRDVSVKLTASQSARGAGSFFPLGIEHILTGYDHLLFLLALILRGGNLVSLLKIVTAFTVAHSITLALAALNIVTLPERLIEATIALSIAYVAAENLFLKRPVSHRWAVSFLFGLVHGFGFSNVLRELGLPKDGLMWSLLNFNLGVEFGQAAAIIAVLPILIWLRRTRFEPRAVATASAIVLVIGLALFVERALLGA